MADTLTSHTVAPSFVAVGDRIQQLDMLLHLQEFSSMVVLVTGQAGVGKTALLEEAQSQLQVHHQVVHVSAHKMMGESDLFQHIADTLGCSASEAGIGLALNQAKNQQETIHVLVDDAHLIEADALQYLVEVAVSEHGWHLILVGDDGLESQLRILQARIKQENLFHTIRLHPFSEDEIQTFLTDVYRQMGQETLPLSQQRIHQLWTLSEGLPSKILDYVEVVETEKATSLTGRLPLGHIAAMLLVGTALYFSYSYHDGSVEQQQDPIAALLSHSSPKPEQSQSLSNEEAEARLEALLNGAVVPTSAGPETEIDVELLAEDLAMESGSQHGISIETTSQLQDKISAEVSTNSDSTAQSTSVQKDIQQKSSVPVKKVASISKPSASTTTKKKATKAGHPLLSAPPKTYALQLLGVRKPKSAQVFMDRLTKQVGSDQVSLYETRYKSAPWYVVVYGPFEDKKLARAAVKKLPVEMQNQRPWVRQLSKIQEDIRKVKQ